MKVTTTEDGYVYNITHYPNYQWGQYKKGYTNRHTAVVRLIT